MIIALLAVWPGPSADAKIPATLRRYFRWWGTDQRQLFACWKCSANRLAMTMCGPAGKVKVRRTDAYRDYRPVAIMVPSARTPGRLPLVNSTPAASRAERWLPYLLGLLLSRLGGLACPNFSATICRTASPRLETRCCQRQSSRAFSISSDSRTTTRFERSAFTTARLLRMCSSDNLTNMDDMTNMCMFAMFSRGATEHAHTAKGLRAR